MSNQSITIPKYEIRSVIYFNSDNPLTATIFDDVKPPTVNNDLFKDKTNSIYVGTDNKSWFFNSVSGVYEEEFTGKTAFNSYANQEDFPPVGDTSVNYFSRLMRQMFYWDDFDYIYKPCSPSLTMVDGYWRNIGRFSPINNSNSITSQGVLLNNTGTLTAVSTPLTGGDDYTNTERILVNANASVNNVVGMRGVSDIITRGEQFRVNLNNGIEAGGVNNTGFKFWMGLTQSVAVASGTMALETDALYANSLGVGYTRGIDTAFKIFTRGTSGTAIKINTGIGIPNVVQQNMIKLVISSLQDPGTGNYFLIFEFSYGSQKIKEVIDTGSNTVNYPALTTSMAYRCNLFGGSTASAISLSTADLVLRRGLDRSIDGF